MVRYSCEEMPHGSKELNESNIRKNLVILDESHHMSLCVAAISVPFPALAFLIVYLNPVAR